MIVTSPTHRWVTQAFAYCVEPIAISSPYVGDYLKQAIAALDGSLPVRLLTRTLLSDFASRASDLDAVHGIAERAGGILSLSSLHAKVYIVGTSRALVTSANATFSGMHRNRECGVEITDSNEVIRLRALIDSGFGTSPRPKLWTADELKELRPSVEALRATLPKVTKREQTALEMAPVIRLRRRELSRVVETFSGWLRLTLEGISQLESDTFNIEEVYQICLPLAKTVFPANQHVREKLRQQMQRLRDLGLVAFLGRGRYQFLATTS